MKKGLYEMFVPTNCDFTCMCTDSPPKDRIKLDIITRYLLLMLHMLSSFKPIVISNRLFTIISFAVFKLKRLIIMAAMIRKQVSVPHINKMVSMALLIAFVNISPKKRLLLYFLVLLSSMLKLLFLKMMPTIKLPR